MAISKHEWRAIFCAAVFPFSVIGTALAEVPAVSLTPFSSLDAASLPAGLGSLAAPGASSSSSAAAGPGGMTQEQIDQEMNNPVGNLWMIVVQAGRSTLRTPGFKDRSAGDIVVQPVLPLKVTSDWNLILHPYLPIILGSPDVQANTISDLPRLGAATGIGDLGIAALFSPAEPTPVGDPENKGRIIWGAGPTLQFPTATDNSFGHHKYQAGPALALGYLDKKISAIMLFQQYWSYGGTGGPYPGTDYATLQYIFGYEFADRWQITTGTPIITFNWKQKSDNVVTFPLGIGLSHLAFLGPLPVKFGIEYERTLVHPATRPYGTDIVRLTLVPVIPQLVSGTLF